MKINKSLPDWVYESVCEVMQLEHNVDLSSFNPDEKITLTNGQLKSLVIYTSISTTFHYHSLLQKELLKQGIDIGSIVLTPPTTP